MNQILLKAPIWVWPLFAVLLASGLRMSRARVVRPQPVIIISLMMLLFSGYGVVSAFQASALALLVWAGMLAMSLMLCHRWGYPQGWQWDAVTQRMHVPGSWLPLGLFMTIFFTRFTVQSFLLFNPALAMQPLLAMPVSAVYGLLSGIFAARALHALRLSRRPASSPPG
jgi:hypothetical protein